MAYVGSYDKKFLDDFLEKSDELRKTKRIDPLGYGIENQWIIDVEKIVQKVPKIVFEDDEHHFMVNLVDVLLIATLEEIFHAVCGLMHEDFDFSVDFLYGIIKDRRELEDFKRTNLYRFFKFMAMTGRVRAGQVKGVKEMNLDIYNAMVPEEDRLEKNLFYNYMAHYLKILKLIDRRRRNASQS